MSLHELLERVKAASGPDRELDAAIHMAVLPDDFASKIMRGDYATHSWRLGSGGVSYVSPNSGGTSGGSHPVAAYTASIDAAVALIERVLPGCEWDVSTASGGRAGYEVEIVRPHGGAWTRPGPTPPLALIAALLEAKIAEDKP
jgi:hypothetical protein